MGKLKDVPEPVHWVLEAGMLPDAPVCEMDAWLEPFSVGCGLGSETGELPLVTDPLDVGGLEAVSAWSEPETDKSLDNVEPFDLESD